MENFNLIVILGKFFIDNLRFYDYLKINTSIPESGEAEPEVGINFNILIYRKICS